MTEQIVNFERMEYALTLFGNSDENIRMLEQGYGVSVVFRGTDIKVSGDAEKVMTCTRCIEGLQDGNSLFLNGFNRGRELLCVHDSGEKS